MAESDQGEKTEEATQQRREDFRKRGQVAQSKELSSLFLLIGSLLCIWLMGRFFLEQMHAVFRANLTDFIVDSVRQGEWIPAAKYAFSKMVIIAAPLCVLLWLVSFASSVVQIGFLYNEEALEFKFDRLDPVQGFKRVFSWKSLIEGLKAVVKVIFIAAIIMMIIKSEVIHVPHLIHYSMEQLFTYLGSITFKLVGGVGIFLTVLSAADYFLQRWDLEKQMRMTKEEIKEEHKSREGDPLIKSRIRRIQRELANKRMMTDVPKADVIVTNPTHIAIALKYDGTMVSPKVLAKGAGAIADKIKELAKEHRIPIVENKPLARTIYKTLKIGQQIPRELYAAVAEVLSYVYRLKKKVKR